MYNNEIINAFKKSWEYPISFCDEVLGYSLWDRQKEIILAVRDHDYVSVKSGHAIGKSYVFGILNILFLLSHPHSHVISTSANYRSLKNQSWKELRSLISKSNIPLPTEGLMPSDLSWSITEKWSAVGLSTKDTEALGGWHARDLLFIVDESSHLDQKSFDAIMSSGGKVLLLGNPLKPEGPFYQTFKSPNWYNLTVSSLDSPNVVQGKKIIPGLATKDWIEYVEKEYGKDSPYYTTRVEGEFAEGSANSLIPLSLVESALKQRYIPERGGNSIKIGVDVARFGDDLTVLLVRDNAGVIDIVTRSKLDTMEVVGEVLRLAEEYDISNNSGKSIFVDSIGVGGGVVDRLKEIENIGEKVVGVNVADKVEAEEEDGGRKYANKRAGLYDAGKSLLKEGFSLNGFDQLKQLSWGSYGFNSRGELKVQKKEEIKKDYGSSPDYSDALLLTLDNSNAEDDWSDIWVV